MLKIATRCITPSNIKKVLDRFRETMKNVEGNIWDCTDKNVQTFVEKTVAKANMLVNQAEDACKVGSIYHQLLPLLQ
jgi:23S rRNA maturation-related 3'-5' exoribonuclease YhaM